MRPKKKPSRDYPVATGTVVSVREGKAHFSALVARAAAGEDITISWHGRPRARLSPLPAPGRVFRVDRAWLKSLPEPGPAGRSEDQIRADRDGRG